VRSGVSFLSLDRDDRPIQGVQQQQRATSKIDEEFQCQPAR
jgi:hypothetical protein